MIPKYLAPEAGELLQLLGEPRVLKVTPAEDCGAYLQFETTHAPGSSVPPRWHHDEDEAFYMLAGEYTFSIGDSCVTAPAGAFAFVPRGTLHAFTNSGQVRGADAGHRHARDWTRGSIPGC
jgi:quercetin dioxygenase-like cupin family protein